MQPSPSISPTPLRPMTVTELLDASFRLYRAHFVTFLGIVALVQVPITIILASVQYTLGGTLGTFFQQLSTGGAPLFTPGSGQSILDTLPIGQIITYVGVLGGIGLLQALILTNLMTGALANAIGRSYLGHPTTIIEAYRFGAGRLVSLIGMGILLSLGSLLLSSILIGLPIGGLVLILTRSNNESPNTGIIVLFGLVIFAAAMLLFVLFAFFSVRFLLGTQAVVLEGRGAVAGLRRSWSLVGGSFWRVIGALLLVSVLAYIIAIIPSQIVSYVLQIIGGNQLNAFGRNQAILTVVSQISTMLVLPLQLTLFTLLYYDLRVRKEGYDLELRAPQPVML